MEPNVTLLKLTRPFAGFCKAGHSTAGVIKHSKRHELTLLIIVTLITQRLTLALWCSVTPITTLCANSSAGTNTVEPDIAAIDCW